MTSSPGQTDPIEVQPYEALAAAYDIVMEHVDYDEWAEYVFELIEKWSPGAQYILELGCGTGSLAQNLQPLGSFKYLGTDRSESMVAIAQAKAGMLGVDVDFAVADYTAFSVNRPVDVVLLLYDGLNYVLDEASVRTTFERMHSAVVPGGICVFDLSTPANSINNAAFFEDSGSADGLTFRRKSTYDETSRIHRTEFDLSIEGVAYHEVHRQRAYEIERIRQLAVQAGFVIDAMLDGFSHDPATDETERAHFVVRRP